MKPAIADAMEYELGWACLLLHAWMQIAALDESGETGRAAAEKFEEFTLPAAVLDPASTLRENAGWRRLFPDGPPAWAREAVEAVLSAETTRPSSQPIAMAERDLVLATAVMALPETKNVALVVCAELPPDEIARALQGRWIPCVWSGSVGSDVVEYANEHMRQLVPDPVGRACETFVHSNDLSSWSHAVALATQDRISPPVAIRLQRRDGEYRWHLVRVMIAGRRWFAAASEHHDVHALEVERDELLDRLRSAQEDAEQAHRLKDQILAGVSHELRAPVTTMMLWERVLRDPMANDATRLQALDAIHQSAAAQSRIVGDLLDVSRAISGKLYVDFRWVDIGQIVGAAVEAALPAALAKRISLTHEGPALTSDITGDASRLRQVIDNLLSNAIKFTDPGGRVLVTLERTGRLVVIKVADTGRGISPTALNRIFEPFSQGETIIARREGGLGLGLTIAKQIVELHHGTLTASSEGEGCGSQFTLTLPSAGQSRAPSPPAGVVPQLSLKGVRILVIDDDDRVCSALALLLTRAGAIVDRAGSAAAARTRMARREPDVIICDIAMPDEDGNEFIRTLRASGDQIPAIALTGRVTRADAEQAVAAGFDLHVAKPVDIERLIATVIRVIESRRRDAD